MNAVARQSSTNLQRAPSPGGLAEVVDLILDKGIVIDAYVRVSVIGIEVLTIDARIVVASVDTYLRFAEAVNRLELPSRSKGLPDMIGDLQESGADRKTQGVLEGVKQKLPGQGDEAEDKEPARKRGE